jgi:PAS domain S-box-containing protein
MNQTVSDLPAPAVFVFESVTGRPVSMNAGAAALLGNLGFTGPDRCTLAQIERKLAAGSTMRTEPFAKFSSVSCELRHQYRRPDGTTLAISRIGTPDTNTTLIVEDITHKMQESRRLRFAEYLTGRILRAPDLPHALDAVLRAVSLYTGWPYGEAWVEDGEGLVRRCVRWRGREGAALSGAGKDGRMREPGEGVVGRAWVRRDVCYDADGAGGGRFAPPEMEARAQATGFHCFVSLPLKANGKLVAVLGFAAPAAKAQDGLSIGIVAGMSQLLSLALMSKRRDDETDAVKHQLSTLLYTAGDAIVSVDARQNILIFNRQAERVFGYEAHEAIGKPLDMLIPMASRNVHAQYIAAFDARQEENCLMGGRSEIRGRRRDGSEFPAEASISRAVIDGAPVYTAVVRDLTAAHKAQEALRAHERQLRKIVETMPFGLSICRASDGAILFVNEAFARLVEVREQDLIGRRIFSFYEAISGGEEDLLLQGHFSGMETAIRTASGTRLWVVNSMAGIVFNDEEALLFGCYDVTDRHKAVAALRRSESYLAEAQRIARLGNWEWDIPTGRIDWSAETHRIFGMPETAFEPTYRFFLERVHPQDRSDVEEAFRNVLSGDMRCSIAHRILLPNGAERFVQLEAEIARDDEGRPLRMIGTVQDVTERYRIERELQMAKDQAEAANRSKSEFLANMSHELRTPLNAIIGFSEIIAGNLLGPMDEARYREYARDIYDSGHHLLNVVNDILDLSRIETGRISLKEQAFALGEMAEFCLRMVSDRVRAGSLRMEKDVPASLPLLYADERLCKQVLLNLLANAIKFTPEGGVIRVEVRYDEDGSLGFAVRDNGIGIKAEDVERVLKPFVQIESHMSRRYQGVGLGLALASDFARLHDGKLWLESAPGQGTSVIVRFPSERTIMEEERLAAGDERPAVMKNQP